jgi:hypothetical protein
MNKHAITTEVIDTGEQRDRCGRRMTPRSRRAEYVEAWRRSGMTQAAFARREGLRYPTFAQWVQQAGKSALAASPVRFAQVRWPLPSGDAAHAGGEDRGASSLGLEVRLPDGTLLRGGDVGQLATLARALRA